MIDMAEPAARQAMEQAGVTPEQKAVDGHRLTRRLVRTEGYFRALVDSGDAVTVVVDGVGRIGWASGPVEAQLGWTDAELAGFRGL